MLFIDHLKELRNRFLRVIIITIAVMIFCTVFGIQLVTLSNHTFYFIVPTVYNNIASQVTLFLSDNLVPPGVDLNSNGSRSVPICPIIRGNSYFNF